MSATTDNASTARSLLTIALHAAMPFAFAACPIVNADARIGSIDWLRMMPVLLPVVGGATVVGAACVAAAHHAKASRALGVTAVVFAFANPLLASLLGAAFAAALSVLSLGHVANVSPYWSFVWLPLSMLEAPLWTLAVCALLAVATRLLLPQPRTQPNSGRAGQSGPV